MRNEADVAVRRKKGTFCLFFREIEGRPRRPPKCIFWKKEGRKGPFISLFFVHPLGGNDCLSLWRVYNSEKRKLKGGSGSISARE